MSDTKRRIAEYKQLLPGLKERVVAVALLLVISLTMVTTTTFAWVVLSRSPEVTGVTTNVAANGNLEIALATGEGKTPPGESKVGDSSAFKDQSIVKANATWGNMINLNDPSYGLENLVLRPAQLNTANLLENPLFGAVYGEDGRITQLSSDFAYTVWMPPNGDTPGYFGVPDSAQLGVRAISSVKIKAQGADAKYYNMVKMAENTNLEAANMYVSLGNNDKYMPSLATMMGLYMTARMNPSHETLSNPDCNIADIQNLSDMYAAFLDCFDAEAKAMAALVNLSLFLEYGDGNYTPYTKEDIYGTTTAELKAKGIQITSLDQFIKDRNTIASDLEKLKTIASSGTSLKWQDSGLNNIVNNLVNVGACTIGKDNTPISSIGASNAANYLSGTQEARITNGILYRFEERTGGYIEVKGLSISATVNRLGMTIPATVKANIQTTAPRDYNLFKNDLDYAKSLNTGDYKGGVPSAEDTFGLAVDFWVRTNAPDYKLVLEGNVLTESEEVRATGKDANGNLVELYTATISGKDEEGNSFSYTLDLYQVKDENNITWHNVDNHAVVTEEELGGNEPVPKMETIITVVGYEGENRVWDKNNHANLTINSTTQGSGSCYIYYADTPEDQARSLELLGAMNVAFVDDEGKLIASAQMDTKHFYANNGKVIVPLVLNPSNSINLGEDDEGNIQYAITALEQNVATRITAIVYLDGTKLTNDMVLAAADIQGQLNIQFGASPSLDGLENEDLMSKELRVTAQVDNNSFDYDTATGDMITNVSINVDGTEPSTVTAFFLRAISATQGSREEVMTFTKNESTGAWEAAYIFKDPGTYVLRSVRLDGIEYALETTPVVEVKGFAVASLSCEQADLNHHISVMTAAGSATVDLNLKFATNDPSKLPTTVQGRFLNDEDGSAVNINFTYNPTNQIWSGSATFLTSGDYTMQYLVLDGKYVELDADMWQTASVTLGMRVAVYTTSPQSFKFLPDEMSENQKNLAMQVKIMDNAGREMPGLTGVKLIYRPKGSGIKQMDADLTWDGKYYVGSLINELPGGGPGIWQFSIVTVGSNNITYATTSPTFTILSPEPPEYHDHGTVAYQYKPNNDAVMNVQITNSAAATVQAYIIKAGAAEGVWVNGVIGGELTTPDGKTANHWNFKVPTDANGYQDGNWQLTKLKLWDVFAADGTAYTQESPLEIDVSNTNNVTKVVNRIVVTFAGGQSQNFGTDASGKVTGKFMDNSYTISGLSVTIKDFENQPIKDISGVMLKYTYGNDSVKYGGYSGPTNTTADFTIALTDNGSGTNFVQSEQKTIQYAGSYAPTFSFVVGSTTVSYSGDNLPANTPKFTVSSVHPTVTIKDRTNHAGSSTNGNTVTVAYGHSTETTCGITYHNYSQASVTLNLSGYGNASGAYLAFTESNGGDVHLYLNKEDAQNKKVDRYTWTADGDCLRWVGYWNSQTGTDRATAAGTIKATQLVLTYGDVDYTVDIEDITIINPTPPS